LADCDSHNFDPQVVRVRIQFHTFTSFLLIDFSLGKNIPRQPEKAALISEGDLLKGRQWWLTSGFSRKKIGFYFRLGCCIGGSLGLMNSLVCLSKGNPATIRSLCP
jgi:hypothetical protein